MANMMADLPQRWDLTDLYPSRLCHPSPQTKQKTSETARLSLLFLLFYDKI
jgi:hypothetical protein